MKFYKVTYEELPDGSKRLTLDEPTSHIYFLYDPEKDWIKIGFTGEADPKARIAPQMKGWGGSRRELLAVVKGEKKDDAWLRKSFAHMKAYGNDWFFRTPELEEVIATLSGAGNPNFVIKSESTN